MADSLANGFNYDDDEFDEGSANLRDEAADKLGELISAQWDDDQDTSDYIRSIREEIDQESDDSLAGGVDLDMDAEISDLLGESMNHLQNGAEVLQRRSDSLGNDFLYASSPLFGEGTEDEFHLSTGTGTAEKDDVLGLESPSIGRTVSPTKTIDLAALGILTEGSDVAMTNGLYHESLPDLKITTEQSHHFGQTSPKVGSVIGGDDVDSGQVPQEGRHSSSSKRLLRRDSKDRSSMGSGDGLSDRSGLMNGHATDHLSNTSSQKRETSSRKRRTSDVDQLAEEAAKLQSEVESALTGKLSDKTLSPLPKSYSSGKYSTSPADIAEMTASVERRWSFKPIIGDPDRRKMKSSPGASVKELLDSQREEKELQLRRTLNDVHEVTGDLADLQHTKEILQRELRILQETLGRNKSELRKCEEQVAKHRCEIKELQAEASSMQKKRDYLQSEMQQLDSILMERRGVQESSLLSPTQSRNAEECWKLLSENAQLKSDQEAMKSKLKADGLAKEKEISELKRQVKAASEDMFTEKKKARDHCDKLKQDYDDAQRQLRDALRDKVAAVNKARDTAGIEKHADLEVLKAKISREKDSELEKLKEKLGKQLEDMKKTLQSRDRELVKANMKWRERNEATNALSAQLREYKKQLAEKDGLLSKTDKKSQVLVDDLNRTLKVREDEIKQLRTSLKQQEEVGKALGEKLRAEARDHARKAVEQERVQQGKAKQQELIREREMVKDEMEKKFQTAKHELAVEQQKSKQIQQTLVSLNQEVEEQRCATKQAHKEKLATVNKIKEMARLARRQDFEKLKKKLQQDHNTVMKKVKSRVAKLEEEIKQAKDAEKILQQKERDLIAKMELTEKSVVMEINDECQKTSVALSSLAVVSQGRRSRPSTPKVTSSMDKIPTSLVERPASAPPVAARKDSTSSRGALSQLRASNDELRKYVSELRAELNRERQTAAQLHRDKVAELKKAKESIQSVQAEEMQAFKHKLNKELLAEKVSVQKQAAKETSIKFQSQMKAKDETIRELRQQLQKWKDEEGQRFSRLMHTEVNQQADKRTKELVRRIEIQQRSERAAHQRETEKLEKELKRLGQEAATHAATAAAAASTVSMSSSPEKAMTNSSAEAVKAKAAVNLVRRLQKKLKLMCEENEQLKRELLELRKAPVTPLGTPEVPQPRANSVEAQDSGLSSMGADSTLTDIHHLQQELKATERKNQRMSVLLSEKVKEVVKLQSQFKYLNKEFLVLQRQHSFTVKRVDSDH
ncbi:uncharacterized protein LOC134176762 isoform X2 [Corticium candelabrum]|uniref:uncharacterized protein LOC134176762 isoform X2 n=1 Tax=Corticium candelabrum TaxID=121492 RepID=UPI002E2755DB|nr:uncharacterized protein LOC134176762 isoform X2 [Corticium candelabrum]